MTETTRLQVDPQALLTAARAVAHDGWAVRLAADDLARALACALPELGDAAEAGSAGLRPLIDAAWRVADSEARLGEALRTLAAAYPDVDGQRPPDGLQRSPARWG